MIITAPSGTQHVVSGDVSENDLVEKPDWYYVWTRCGITVTGRLTKTKARPTTKPCRRCFKELIDHGRT